MHRSNKAFSLTEIVVVILIFGVGIGLFHTVFVNNWSAYEDRIRRANLWSEANRFFELLSIDARNAQLVNIALIGNAKTVSLTNAVAPNALTTYSILNNGNLIRAQNNDVRVLSTHAVFANSDFTQNGRNLRVNLELQDSVFTRDIHISAETEILLRN